jgi:hypothetical protein
MVNELVVKYLMVNKLLVFGYAENRKVQERHPGASYSYSYSYAAMVGSIRNKAVPSSDAPMLHAHQMKQSCRVPWDDHDITNSISEIILNAVLTLATFCERLTLLFIELPVLFYLNPKCKNFL